MPTQPNQEFDDFVPILSQREDLGTIYKRIDEEFKNTTIT